MVVVIKAKLKNIIRVKGTKSEIKDQIDNLDKERNNSKSKMMWPLTHTIQSVEWPCKLDETKRR